MRYLLAATHTAPADPFTVDGMRHITSYYVRQAEAGNAEAIALLASAGIVPHYPTTDPCPFGSTWTLDADGWHETPSGTAEAIAAALAEQHMADLRTKWAEKDAATKRQEALEALRNPDDITTLADAQARIAALVQLIGEA